MFFKQSHLALFFQALRYDAVFYFISGFLFFIYQWFIAMVIVNREFSFSVALATLLFVGSIVFFWIWNTYALFSRFEKRKISFGSWALWAGILFLIMVPLLFFIAYEAERAHNALLSFLMASEISLFGASLVISSFLLGVVIPFFVFCSFLFHRSLILRFRGEQKWSNKQLIHCVFVFVFVTLCALISTFLPEESEFVVSGLLLMVYFTWQKTYLLVSK